MSPAGSADPAPPARRAFGAELDELNLQVELMLLCAERSLERARLVLQTGSHAVAAQAIASDDEIDAMNVSLTQRCYHLLARESPMASDLRLVVSVVRVTSEIERIGDLALRVAKLVDAQPLMAAHPDAFDILLTMADEAFERFRLVERAWGERDLGAAAELAEGSPCIELCNARLTESVLGLGGPDAVIAALRIAAVARAFDRIVDHTVVLGARLRYLITGDLSHLAAEVR